MSTMDILLMRHGYDDHSYIDGLNDTSLTPEGIEMAKAAGRRYVPKIGREYDAGIVLRVSSKRRTVETADILSEELNRQHVIHSVVVDANLRELYQGDMVGIEGKNHGERIRMLTLGCELFERERVAGNTNYKYGMPDFYNPRYDAFNAFVAPPYGESQNELSTRIETGFSGAVNDALATSQTPFFVAHWGTVREIMNITIAHNTGRYDVNQNLCAEMVGAGYCELFKTHLNDVDFSLGALARKVYSQK